MLMVRVGIGLVLAALAVIASVMSLPGHQSDDDGRQAIFVASEEASGPVFLTLIVPYTTRQPGLAHYLEHLVFLSAIKGKWGDTDPDTNAHTDENVISYEISGNASDLEEMLRVLAGVFNPITLSPQVAEDERAIVMREYEYRYADDVAARADEATRSFLYAGTQFAVSVIGSPQDIEKLTLDDARRLHAASHLPQRAILHVTGNVRLEDVETALHASGFPKLAAFNSLSTSSFLMASPAERSFVLPDEVAQQSLLWDKIVSLPRSDSFEHLATVSYLLADILEGGLEGSIGKPLHYDGFLARDVDVRAYPLDESHVEFYIRLHPDLDVSLVDLRSALERALAESARGIPPSTFARLHKRVADTWLGEADWAGRYQLHRLARNRMPVALSELRAIDDNLTVEDINVLAASLVQSGRLAVVQMGRGVQE